MTANEYRGETALTLGDEEYVLVPSYANLVAVEDACRCGVLELTGRLQARQAKTSELAIIVACCAKPPIDVDNAGDAVLRAGAVRVMGNLGVFLTSALLGGTEGEDEAAAGSA